MTPSSLLFRAFPMLLVIAAPMGVSHAQGSRQVTIELMLPNEDGVFMEDTSPTNITDFFNLARCECAQAAVDPDPMTDPQLYFQVKLTATDQSSTDQADLVVGSSCDNNDPELRKCETVASQLDVGQLRGDEVPILVDRLMFPNEACQEREVSRNVWILYDDGADDIIDEKYTLANEISADAQPPPRPTGYQALPGENAVTVAWDPIEERSNDVLQVYVLCSAAEDPYTPLFPENAGKAEYDTTDTLCGIPVGSVEPPPDVDAGVPDAGMPVDAGVLPDAGTLPDASTLPDAGTTPTGRDDLTSLDPSFICGEAEGQATSIRVGGLENGVEYEFALLTVDEARNASYQYVGTAIPAAVTDFWEDYNERGGQADGGVCLVTSTYGDSGGATQALRAFRDNTLASFAVGRVIIDMYYDFVAPLGVYADRYVAVRIIAGVVLAPVVALAAVWEYTGPFVKLLLLLGLIGWRRRRALRGWLESRLGERAPTARVAAASAAVLLLAWSGSAGAQGYDAWQDFAPVRDSRPPEPSKWNFGLKLGPYVPAIDSEFDLAEGQSGPYESMFGGSAVMTQLELDRFVLWPAGQLGITGSVGFMGKTASAYAVCPAGGTDCVDGYLDANTDGVPDRAQGENTSFRLIPLSLGVVYRFTGLDDRIKVPLVPYAKAGISYYLWWIRQPDGSLAEAPTPACPDPGDSAMDCDGDRALGASLGVQASIGLAFRAERIDRQSALSLREEFGIEHAGFYAELMYASVDGFGQESKLAVGALTWFAGLNFEF